MRDLKEAENIVKWKSPSNIAIVKYWGKKDVQIPINPSISFGLSNAFTETEIIYSKKKSPKPVSVEFYFEGRENKSFELKILDYLHFIEPHFNLFKKYHLTINSRNTFPHSAGIASSASSMSSLVLCLLSIEYVGQKISEKDFLQKASYFSRLASGSACRSVYPGFSLWGKTEAFYSSSNDYAVNLPDVHPLFNEIQDAILIVKSGTKKISSREGHQLMEKHPYRQARIQQTQNHSILLIRAIKDGDFKTFANICESEALSLHAMMMTSSPSYFLMQAESLKIIEKIQQFRIESGLDLCFTLDAGPNIHLIYTKAIAEKISGFIRNELLVYCESGKWLDDHIGNGPEQLNNTLYEK